jgi:hypothetical protein
MRPVMPLIERESAVLELLDEDVVVGHTLTKCNRTRLGAATPAA